MRHKFLICCTMLLCFTLMPTMWYLWIDCGVANANFYFGVTLGYSISLVALLLVVASSNDYC
ncbi:unnamed protein product [Soboliphyme baturini]|uniref:TMhelix containing protein n=1 Tax=Soboliphyme baturini TaxID=241478 RepID=A0A183ID52_9BILA|nr:unnamed protein product [Soboliphyme baturini]